jgi:peptidylprolyl isomerase
MGFALTLDAHGAQGAPDPENLLVMDLEQGKVVIELLPDLAPKHVARIRELTREGFYDGVVFHRVMDGFMAQTGDPTGTGRGGSGQNIEAEFSSEPFVRGTVGMARAQNPDSADSQFFICFAAAQFLNNNYTVWGRVIEGMEAVDQIKKAPAGRQSGMVDDPDKILRMQVQADIN